MSARAVGSRRSVQKVLSPRRARRGKERGGTGQRLVWATPGPATFESGVAGGGAVARLQTANGQNILLAGVAVTISVPVATGAPSVTATPSITVLTDASGQATFTSLTLTGLVGTYSLRASATGYTAATSTGHQLIAGPPVASLSTAVVPNGNVGQPTTVRIQLRDALGNLYLRAAPLAVTVQVTGANPIPQITVNFNTVNGYQLSYTPTNTGTDTVIARYGGTSIGGSPYTSVVSGNTGTFTATSLRVTQGGNIATSLIGKGAGVSGGVYTTAEPIYRCAQGQNGPTTLETNIDIADDKDILLVVPCPGPRDDWCDWDGTCFRWNSAKFDTSLATYTGRSKITDALKRRRLVWWMNDEPWISQFCGTMTPSVVRDTFRRVKAAWPDCIIVARMEVDRMNGWNGISVPAGYFDKLDYACASYNGRTRDPSRGMSPVEFYDWAITQNLANGYGTFAGANWLNLGDRTDCWDAFNDGSGNARIHGDNSLSGQVGLIERCTVSTTETRWAQSPAAIIEVVSGAAQFSHFPFIWSYRHPDAGAPVHAIFKDHLKRSDYVTGWTAALNAANARTSFDGWRTPK